MYFLSRDLSDAGLYRSDGTAGIQLVRDFLLEPQNPVANELVVYADRLYFAARDAEHGRELWQSDGTGEGTTLVRDLAGNPSGRPAGLTVAGGKLFFSAFDHDHGQELWQTGALNGQFWVLYGALSNVEYTLTVADSQTGTVRTYSNSKGRFASVADTGAF